MKTRRVITQAAQLALLGGALALTGAASYADPMKGRGDTAMGQTGFMGQSGFMGQGRIERMARELDLSAVQRQEIEGLMESMRPNRDRLAGQARENAQLLRVTQPDAPNYSEVVAQVSRSAGELASETVNQAAAMRAQVWKVLTPEQRVKLDAQQVRRAERVREWRETRKQRQ